MAVNMDVDKTNDQYKQYCERTPEQIQNAVAWWNTQAVHSPQLTQMATDMLSVPAMSTEYERVFSSAKLLVTDRRNQLSEEAIETNERLRAWIRNGYVDLSNAA